MATHLYENQYYKVERLEPEHMGEEEYNWAVINKGFCTTEYKAHALPDAIVVCDNLARHLHSLLEDVPETSKVKVPNNVVHFNERKH